MKLSDVYLLLYIRILMFTEFYRNETFIFSYVDLR